MTLPWGKISPMKLISLCPAADVAPGCAVRAEHGGCTYAVFNVEGKHYVTQDECTHGPGSGHTSGLPWQVSQIARYLRTP